MASHGVSGHHANMPVSLTHYIFATASPYSHVLGAVRLSVRIVTHDPGARISMILHANNVLSATSILESTPEAASRIHLCPVGETGAHKAQQRAYLEMIGGTSGAYERILRVSVPF